MRMTFRVETRDGTVVVVSEADLEVVTAYLVLRGYPPISVAVADSPASDLDEKRGEVAMRARA
jgi:hypothetical protein